MIIKNANIVTATEDIIIHQVNCQNVMGSGVAKALYTKWPKVKTDYHSYCDTMFKLGFSKEDLLGHILPVKVETNPNKFVINCYSQLTFGSDGRQHTDYEAIKECFNKINVVYDEPTVALPYMYGCGLGGGDWNIVSEIIENLFGDRAIIYKI
jgi:O-acetyl-ADP-ribose deacetylase (regulator of RNase III)